MTANGGGTDDICSQLLSRYSRSSAPQHQHLCAAAAAARSVIESSSLPLTHLSYFAATITSLSNYETLDPTSLASLTTFLSLVLPLIGKGEIKEEKAVEAFRVLIRIVEDCRDTMGNSGVRALVKCVGVLVAEFCDLENWESVGLGFEWLVKISIDKRPKVRKCGQECLLAVFKLVKSSNISNMASKSVYVLLKDHMPVAVELAALKIVDGSKIESVLKPEHQEVLHLLNLMKHVVPYLTVKFRTKMLLQLMKILDPRFSTVTRHVFDVMSVIFDTAGSDSIASSAGKVLNFLQSYMEMEEKNPVDSVLFAATLAKCNIDKLHEADFKEWMAYFPMIVEILAGILSSEVNSTSNAFNLLRELIDRHLGESLLIIVRQQLENKSTKSAEFRTIEATCTAFHKVLDSSSRVPNELFFSVLSFLFLKLGKISDIFMKPLLLKIADRMNAASVSTSEKKYLRDSLGYAVVAMGPEKLLELVPINFNTEDFSCKNVWLIPVLKENVVGSSLRFFVEHIIPLAKSFEQASNQVKKARVRQDLQAHARGCWELLPAFCRYPSDTYKSFGGLAELLVSLIKKDSFMLEIISIALQELVNQNYNPTTNDQGSTEIEAQKMPTVDEFAKDLKTKYTYSKITADKNAKALATCSVELLNALTNVFFESSPETRKHLKGAISCLVSICDSCIPKQIVVDSVEKFRLLDDVDKEAKMESETEEPADQKQRAATSVGSDASRCLVLELSSCIIDRSDASLVNLIFSVIKHALEVTDEAGHVEAYGTLSKILEKHSWFCSSEFDVLMDFLTGLKSSINTATLRSRFACLQNLFVRALMRNVDEENSKAFLILNEIILMLKDSDEERRKEAYDALHGLSSKLRNSSDLCYDGLYHKFIAMITGYLSGSSPHIKSGVVSALSVLVYADPDICLAMPDVLPAVLELLHSKAVEIIKAILGFVKVLVSCLKPDDLKQFLPNILDGVVRWSSVSRHHFKAKVVVILEIMIRKCGFSTIKALVPEKYNDFVQGVMANRHGKTNLKEGGTQDFVPELGRHKGGKRKRDGFAFSSMRPQKRKWDDSKQKSDQFHLQKGNRERFGNRGRSFKSKLKETSSTEKKKSEQAEISKPEKMGRRSGKLKKNREGKRG